MSVSDLRSVHRLKTANRIQSERLPQCKKAPKRLDDSKLNQDSTKSCCLQYHLQPSSTINVSLEDAKETSTVMLKAFHSLAATSLDRLSKNHQK